MTTTRMGTKTVYICGQRQGARRPAAGQCPSRESPSDVPKPVRRRVAIVAHADRDSVLAAVLLARELRLVEGIWVYTQAELMSFFRGGATDLRDETPIYVVGFTPSPARDVIQAAADLRRAADLGRPSSLAARGSRWPARSDRRRQGVGRTRIWGHHCR